MISVLLVDYCTCFEGFTGVMSVGMKLVQWARQWCNLCADQTMHFLCRFPHRKKLTFLPSIANL